MEEQEPIEESSSSPVYSEDDVEKALAEKKAEIEEKAREEAREELLSEKERLLAEKEEKEAELSKIKEEVEGLKDKDRNFENLRKKVAGADKVEKELGSLKKQIAELKEEPIKAIKEEFVHENIGDDDEDKKVFNYYYERLKVDAPDRESARKVLKDAYLLFQNAKGLLNQNPFNNIIGTRGNPGFTEGMTAMQKEFFRKFGVTDEMLERNKNAKKEG